MYTNFFLFHYPEQIQEKKKRRNVTEPTKRGATYLFNCMFTTTTIQVKKLTT